MADDSEQVILRILGDNADVLAKIAQIGEQARAAGKPIDDIGTRVDQQIVATQAVVNAFQQSVALGDQKVEETARAATASLAKLYETAASAQQLSTQQLSSLEKISKQFGETASRVKETGSVSDELVGKFGRLASVGTLVAGAAHAAGDGIKSVITNSVKDLPQEYADHLKALGTELSGLISPAKRVTAIFDDFSVALELGKKELREQIAAYYGVTAATEAQSVAAAEAAAKHGEEATAIRKLAADIDDSIRKRHDASEEIVKLAAIEEQSGKLTGAVLAETKERVKDLLEQYDRVGERAPADLQALADKLGVVTDAQKRAAEEAKRLAEEQERAATRAAEAKLRQAEREVEASLRSAERQVEDSKRIAESVRGETKDLEARTEAVVSWAQEVASSGTASREEIAQVRKVVQDQLDTYSRLGKEAPADLQAVAKEWHVTTSDVEKDAEKAKKALEGVEKGFASLVDRLNKGTNAKNPADELAAALAERDQLSNKSTQSQEDLDRITELDQKISDLRFSVKEEGDTWFNSNKRIELSTKDVRQAVLDLFTSSRESLRDLSQDQRDEIQRTLQNLLTLGDSGKASASDLDSALRGVRDVLQGAGVDTSDLDISLEKAGGQAFDLNRAFDDLGKKDVKETIGGVAALGDESEKSAEKQKAISEQITAWRKELDQIKKDDALGTAGQSAEQLRDRLEEVTEIAKELRKTLAGTDTGAGGEGGDTAP